MSVAAAAAAKQAGTFAPVMRENEIVAVSLRGYVYCFNSR